MKKYKLDKLYIIEAKQIRELYIKLLKRLALKEDKVFKIKNEILSLTETIENFDVNNLDRKVIDDRLDLLSNTIDKFNKEINISNEDKEKLVKRSDILYEKIKDQYPLITKTEIIDLFYPHIKEIDEKYNIK